MPINGQPGVQFPALARVTDLPSTITTLNQVKDILSILLNQFEEKIHWVVRAHKMEVVRVTNPNDENQWVDVERITHIVWQNTVTKELFEWKWPNA